MSLTSLWRKCSLGKLFLRVILVWTFLIDFDKFYGLQGRSGSVQGLALNYASQHSTSDWTERLLLEVPNSSAETTYEIAQLDIKKLVRKRREVGGDDEAISYNGEIIQMTRPSTNSSFFIKLEMKPLVSPTFSARMHDNGEETEFPIQRDERWQVYSGKILPTSESSDTETLGTAALSICNENGGLCGLIVTEDEHLVIQPRPLARADTSAPPHTFIIENDHVLAKVSDDFRASSCRTSDELRVPKAKLAEAAEAQLHYKMSASGLSRKNKHSTLLIPLTSEDSEEAIKDTHFYSQTPFDGVPLASTSATSGGKKVVEIAVFTDPDLYERLRKRFPKDTVQKIKDYVIAMINTMDLLYRHKSLGVNIEFSLVHLEIMKKYPSKLNKNGGKAMAYLSSFCDYAGEKNTNAEMWDHALLLTGMDLKEDGTSSTAGLAWAGTMCYRYYSCSISEGHSFGTAYIITHEIGHSLGMEHDGMGVSQSCDRDKYLMSPTTGPGKVEWSSCSRKNLVDFLSFGSAELRSSTKAHKPTCLNESKRSTNKIDVTADINNLPGKRYDASQQCVLAMGSKFKPVLRKSEPPFDNICWMLYCGNGTHAISTHPALEGSKCDDGKHCRSGKCVKIS